MAGRRGGPGGLARYSNAYASALESLDPEGAVMHARSTEF